MPTRILAALALACLSACAAMPARAAGPPDSLVRAIVHVESGGNPRTVGTHGEIGLMQIKLETARSVGYRGSRAGLFDPATNLRFGTAYLEIAWHRARGDLCAAASLFNMGVFARPRCTAYGHAVVAALHRL
jgi:soluble lytic murein transglycosylase-like protein